MQVIEEIFHRDQTALPPRLVHTSNPGAYKSSLPPSLLRWSVFAIDIATACLIAVFTLYAYQASILDVSLRTALPYMLFPCLLYTSPSPRDQRGSRMPSSA